MIDAERVDSVVDRIRDVDRVVVEDPRRSRQGVVVEVVISHGGDAVCGDHIALECGSADYAIDCLLCIRIKDLAAINWRAVARIRSENGRRQ